MMESWKNPARAMRPVAARWDWPLVLFLTPLAFALTSFLINGFVDPYDEGLHFLAYPIYRAGRIPYIDFYPLFPPIWTYANIIIEEVFGDYLLAQRLWFLLQACLVVWASYALCLKVYSRRLAALGVVGLVIVFGFNPYWMPRWSGARLAVYALLLLLYIQHVERPKTGARGRLFVLGLVTGLANLYALDVGIHLTATGAAMFAVTFFGTKKGNFRGSARRFAAALAGFFLPLSLWAAYLAYYGALLRYISTYYYVYIFQLMPISTEILSGGEINFRNPRVILLSIFLLLLGSGLLYHAFYRGFVQRDLNGPRRALVMAMLLSFAVSVSTLRGVEGPQYLMFALVPIILWGGLIASRLPSLLQKFHKGRPERSAGKVRAALIQASALLTIAVLSKAVTPVDTASKIFVTEANIEAAGHLLRRDGWLGRNSSNVRQLACILDRHLDPLALYLRSHPRPGEAVLAFPMNVDIIPALAGRPSATAYPVAVLIMGSHARQLEYIHEIERARPRYAVVAPFMKFGGKKPIRPYFKPVYRYLGRHYRQAGDFPKNGYFQIWVRKKDRERAAK